MKDFCGDMILTFPEYEDNLKPYLEKDNEKDKQTKEKSIPFFQHDTENGPTSYKILTKESFQNPPNELPAAS